MNRCFTDLARIKSEIKKLEEQAATAQSKCIKEHGTPGKVETKYGTLVFNERENWRVVDKDVVVQQMGPKEFIARATIAFGKIKEYGGQAFVANLEEVGAVEFTGVTQYYALREPKK
jgi:hypothetical protein